jgi:hypothetical protein
MVLVESMRNQHCIGVTFLWPRLAAIKLECTMNAFKGKWSRNGSPSVAEVVHVKVSETVTNDLLHVFTYTATVASLDTNAKRV